MAFELCDECGAKRFGAECGQCGAGEEQPKKLFRLPQPSASKPEVVLSSAARLSPALTVLLAAAAPLRCFECGEVLENSESCSLCGEQQASVA